MRVLQRFTSVDILAVAMAVTWVAIAPVTAHAQDYPNKPIKLVVPFPAGGSSDATVRLLADELGPVLKQSVAVDNKGGAGGLIGTDVVAKSPADDYTLAGQCVLQQRADLRSQNAVRRGQRLHTSLAGGQVPRVFDRQPRL